jgi:catechol 2,3-dioxygenase-like lactoylglutathione lyase family enzyme
MPPATAPDAGAVALDHVQVAAPAGCEAEARRFYGEVLGLVEVPKPAALRGRGGVWFALAGAQLHVGVAEPFSPARTAHPAFRLHDSGALTALARRVEATGAPVAWDDALARVRRFFTEDPWGNRLELLAAARGD